MNREELAWAAGLFDGEGHCGKIKRTDGGLVVPHLDITQGDRYVLDRFAKAVGVGRVHGPYDYKGRKPHHLPRWIYAAQSIQHVQAIVAMLWTWLSPTKREQAATALLAATASSRSRPGKLHLRTICKRGHSLTDPTNIYRIRIGRYTMRRCKQCESFRKHEQLVRRTAIAMLSA